MGIKTFVCHKTRQGLFVLIKYSPDDTYLSEALDFNGLEYVFLNRNLKLDFLWK